MVKTFVALLIALCPMSAWAQTESQKTGTIPIYRIVVVARTAQAINYRHRSGATKIDFRGTTLLPDAKGTAEVASKQGAIHIKSDFQGLEPASKFGPEYLTYVMWAVSPEGRPVNLGEVLLGEDGKKQAGSDQQSAGVRPDRNRRTLLCCNPTERRRRAGERSAFRHEGTV